MQLQPKLSAARQGQGKGQGQGKPLNRVMDWVRVRVRVRVRDRADGSVVIKVHIWLRGSPDGDGDTMSVRASVRGRVSPQARLWG